MLQIATKSNNCVHTDQLYHLETFFNLLEKKIQNVNVVPKLKDGITQ